MQKALTVAAFVLLAGCLESQDSAVLGSSEETGAVAIEAATAPTGPVEPGHAGSNNPAPDPASDEEQASPPPSSWGPADAPIHPGTIVGDCTSNFVFTDKANRHIYIGSAAHCFGRDYEAGESAAQPCTNPERYLPIGSPVRIVSDEYNHLSYYSSTDHNFSRYVINVTGTLAYSSWTAMAEADETDPTICGFNDFALVELPIDAKASVTPCAPEIGCPTRVATADEILFGLPAACYCHSAYWLGLEPLTQKRGIVSQGTSAETDDWWYLALYDTPIFYGDSGSPGFVDETLAGGVLSYFATNPSPIGGVPGPGNAGYTVLATALAYMEAHTKFRVELAQP